MTDRTPHDPAATLPLHDGTTERLCAQCGALAYPLLTPGELKSVPCFCPATARARSVLPVPGGPTSRTPFGIRPPRRWYFFGLLRKSTTSISSA